MKIKEVKEILKNINLDLRTKFAIEQALVATFELEEGFYYSKVVE